MTVTGLSVRPRRAGPICPDSDIKRHHFYNLARFQVKSSEDLPWRGGPEQKTMGVDGIPWSIQVRRWGIVIAATDWFVYTDEFRAVFRTRNLL